MKAQYYRITSKYQDWLGKRIFKWDVENDLIIQVCFATGEQRKGRQSSPGITVISKQTFSGNYMMSGYIEPTTKRTFDNEAEKCYNFLIGLK